jgi:hypothetical protein
MSTYWRLITDGDRPAYEAKAGYSVSDVARELHLVVPSRRERRERDWGIPVATISDGVGHVFDAYRKEEECG